MRRLAQFAAIPGLLAVMLASAFVIVPGVAGEAHTAATTRPTVLNRHAPRIRNNGTATSTNWSGYAVTGATGAYTDVKGTWVAPTASCSSRQTAYSSFWVGIDGDSSNSVEQLGTDSDCRRGHANYSGWYEMYPNPLVQLSTGSFPVSPGIRCRLRSTTTATAPTC